MAGSEGMVMKGRSVMRTREIRQLLTELNQPGPPKFATGGYISAQTVPGWTPGLTSWAPLRPDECVIQSDGLVLEAWEYHLIRSLAGGRGE